MRKEIRVERLSADTRRTFVAYSAMGTGELRHLCRMAGYDLGHYVTRDQMLVVLSSSRHPRGVMEKDQKEFMRAWE